MTEPASAEHTGPPQRPGPPARAGPPERARGPGPEGPEGGGGTAGSGDLGTPEPEPEPEQPAAVPLLVPRDGLPPLVVTDEELAAAAGRLADGTGPVAVDAERASGFRYGHRAFLVQLRRDGAGTVLIDPVACPDLAAVDAALAGTEAVLHAAGQDLPCLADIGLRPRRLFDTELAGRLLGYPRVGLGTLVEQVLGLRLEKTHSAADWSARPLPQDWLLYAALDVEVLIELRDALAGQLAEQGKDEWARQEFAAILAAGPPPPRPDPWRRTSGIHRVRSRRGLAVVCEMWYQRDRIAQQRDISPTRILPDAAIVEAARAQPVTIEELGRVAGFTGRGARRYATEWLAAVRRARALPDAELPDSSAPASEGPPPAHRWQERDPVAAQRLAGVRAAVAALADSRNLPAENLLAPDAVRRLCWQPPQPVTPESVAGALAGYGARAWQVEMTALPVARALLRVAEKAGA